VYGHEGAPLKFELGEDQGWMGQKLTIHRPFGCKQFIIRYSTLPESSALQWLSAEQTAGNVHPFVFSQCQPIHARSLLPCQDTPYVRMTFTASITVPEPLVPLMSADVGVKRPGPTKDSATYDFQMPQAIPSYLLAITIGHFTSYDFTERIRVYAEPETIAQATYEFAQIPEMLEQAERLFGPYRWHRFDFAVMPPAFPYGGMENPRLTFLTPTLLAGDRSLANVLTHELAHSWTGNLVTNATMNDFWLNEGFTVWAERRIMEALFGSEVADLGAAIGRADLDAALKGFGPDSPFSRLKNNLEGINPDEVYSQVPYEKGYLLVKRLEEAVGRPAFDRFLQDYLRKFQFSSITTETFLAFLLERMPAIAVTVNLEEWIYGLNLPQDAPRSNSAILESLLAISREFDATTEDLERLKSFDVMRWELFLSEIAPRVTREHLDRLEAWFSFSTTTNSELMCKWALLCIAHQRYDLVPGLEQFLSQVGRMKYLKPLYLALCAHESGRALARRWFESYGSRYHPIAREGVARILDREPS
jgi:aminopeptidase N